MNVWVVQEHFPYDTAEVIAVFTDVDEAKALVAGRLGQAVEWKYSDSHGAVYYVHLDQKSYWIAEHEVR